VVLAITTMITATNSRTRAVIFFFPAPLRFIGGATSAAASDRILLSLAFFLPGLAAHTNERVAGKLSLPPRLVRLEVYSSDFLCPACACPPVRMDLSSSSQRFGLDGAPLSALTANAYPISCSLSS